MIDWLQLNFSALLNVIVIDVVLAGDNAIIVGLAASRVKEELRSRVILWGIVGAVLLRIVFAALATQLLAIVGLLLAGGLLLLWVCWKMYWELTHKGEKRVGSHGVAARTGQPVERRMSFRAAVTQIVVADVSMSLDNVLAVAGRRQGLDPTVLIIGLAVGDRVDGGGRQLHRQHAGPLSRGLRGSAFSSSSMLPSTWCSTARARSPAPPGRECGARQTCRACCGAHALTAHLIAIDRAAPRHRIRSAMFTPMASPVRRRRSRNARVR